MIYNLRDFSKLLIAAVCVNPVLRTVWYTAKVSAAIGIGWSAVNY